jgi:oligopeptide/dipeptide ABC transporter ATP-binding protein
MMETSTTVRPLLQARDIVQEFRIRSRRGVGGGVLHAVAGVSFDVRQGETLGIIGESGSGKTTLARALLQAPRPVSGSVHFRGAELTKMRGARLFEHRRHMQLVFQDPFGSLNPRWNIAAIVEEPLIGYRWGDRMQRRRKVGEMLELVGLPSSSYARRRPPELSGGQCQRVAIARALALEPTLLILDEAVSALDVLIQAQLLNLFEQLRAELGLAYLFISHDLTLVKQVSDRLGVLHLGQLCEIGPAASLYSAPRHPYSRMLIASIPTSQPASAVGSGTQRAPGDELPSPLRPPSGCRFRTRCPRAQERCVLEEPRLRSAGDDHLVACHFPESAPGGRTQVFSLARKNGAEFPPLHCR